MIFIHDSSIIKYLLLFYRFLIKPALYMIYQKITKYANSHFPILLLSVIIILLNTKGCFYG
ncbi:predicted protein [Enterococcus faecalis Merz96]|nr:predicted protein [Enterococcus faecalis Merz96]